MCADCLNNEDKLVLRIAEGDEVAFIELYNFYRDRVYAAALKVSRSETTAEEVVQDVFLKIWNRRNRLTEIRNIKAYVFVVTRNHTYKVLKQVAQKFEIRVDDVFESECAESDNPLNFVIQKEHNSILQKAIDELPLQQRVVYNLIKRRGLKRKEAADLLNIKPDTVKFHLAHAIKNIRAYCSAYLNLKILFIFFYLDSLY